jgi:hypothetical protein
MKRQVGVNFDTANLVLYGLDRPLRALELLRKRVTSVISSSTA